MNTVNILGFLGSLTSALLLAPQALKAWRQRRNSDALAGLSSGTQWLCLSNAVIWVFYAWASHAVWAGVPSFVTFPLAAFTLWLIYSGSRGVSDSVRPVTG